MKRFAFAVVLLLVAVVAFIPSSIRTQQVERPAFVEKRMERCVGLGNEPHAWGIAQRGDGTEFCWFAFTNSDGYYQLRVSIPLVPQEVAQISTIQDSWKRKYAYFEGYDEDYYIGTSNDWMWVDTIVGSDDPAITDMYMKALSKVFKDMKVVEYL